MTVIPPHKLVTDPGAIAWAAGLYEGEGCASLDISGPSISVTIGMTDEEPLRLFHEIIKVGIMKGPFLRTGNRKQFWLWRVRSWDDAEVVYQLFHKWLSPRRIEQFEYAFSQTNKRPSFPESCSECDPLKVTNEGLILHLNKSEKPCKAAWISNQRFRRVNARN